MGRHRTLEERERWRQKYVTKPYQKRRAMNTVTLNFNVDISKLQELGVDPTTSEGKERLRTLFLEGLDALRSHPAGISATDEQVCALLTKES